MMLYLFHQKKVRVNKSQTTGRTKISGLISMEGGVSDSSRLAQHRMAQTDCGEAERPTLSRATALTDKEFDR